MHGTSNETAKTEPGAISGLVKRSLFARRHKHSPSYLVRWGMVRLNFITFIVSVYIVTVALAQWVRALAPQAEGWVFESQPT